MNFATAVAATFIIVGFGLLVRFREEINSDLLFTIGLLSVTGGGAVAISALITVIFGGMWALPMLVISLTTCLCGGYLLKKM